MKKALSILIIALVLVLAISLTSCDNNQTIPDDEQQTIDNYEAEIARIEKIIEELRAGLITANEALEALKNADLKLDAWNEASAALPAKLEALEKVAEEFVKDVTIYDEDGETVLVSFYEIYVDMDAFEELAAIAEIELYRATSVAAMDEIIKNFKTDLYNVPTALETLVSAIEAAEANGVSLEDYDNILLAHELIYFVDNDVYAEDQREELEDRLAELVKAFKPLAVEHFVTLVYALPENVAHLAPSHEEALEAATEAYAFVLELYNNDDASLLLDKKNKPTVYANAKADLADYNVQWTVVECIVESAQLVNEILMHAFDEENFTEEFGANIETLTYLNSLKALIEDWECTIVTDPYDEDYSAEIYNLVNRSIYYGYVAQYEAKVADLRVTADAFINAVAALEGTITPDSRDSLMAAYDLYDAAVGLVAPSIIDTLCGYYDYVDEDGEIVEIIGVQDSLYILTNKYHAEYTWLVSVIKALEHSIEDAVIKCEFVHKDANGKTIDCDGKGACAHVGMIDYTRVENFDYEIVIILSYFNLDETVFDADALAEYKIARIIGAVEMARANVYEANAAYPNAGLVTYYNAQIDKTITADYTFAVELDCTCYEGYDEPCECDTYVMAIENDPIAILAEKFDLDALMRIFADAQ